LDGNLSSSEVERILRRACELADSGEVETGISEAALIAAAEEAGIPAAAVRRSIAIERLGPPQAKRRIDRLVGPPVVTVDIDLAMPVVEALSRLDVWMVNGHHLRRERWAADGAAWRRREGIVAAGSRTIRHSYGEARLSNVRGMSAVARETPSGTVLRVGVDRSADRAGWLGSGSAVAMVTTGAAVVGTVVAVPIALLLAPVGIVAGAGIARVGRSQADDVEREVRRVLDAVEHRMQPTSLRQDFTRWALQRTR
jgi:hypothetical protein